MPDAAPPLRPVDAAGDAEEGRPLTPAEIDRVLADFRQWLGEFASPPPRTPEPPVVDLHTLVAQFTGLRHEVNLGTKATRAAVEQSAEMIAALRSAEESEPEESPAAPDPSLKALVDVYDHLALALRQVTKQRDALEPQLVALATPRRSFFGKVDASGEAATKLVRDSFDGLIAGYKMSLARIDRAIEQSDLSPIAALGEPFDPELMEAVEVVAAGDAPPGTVMEEMRRGYLLGDTVYRYAQVKVAR